MSVRMFLFAAALLAASFVRAGERVEVPLGDFFKDREFSSVSLSPTGEYITISKPEGDRTVLAAFRVADMKLVGKWDYGENKHIDRVRWVNNERFLMYVSLKLGRFDQRVGNADLYVSNVDGSHRIDIPNGNTYRIVDMLWDDPNNILVSRSIDSAFLFKLNVMNARTVGVATAPVQYGTFVVDHDHQVRYAVGGNDKNESIVLRREGEGWSEIQRSAMGEDTRQPLGFAADNKRVLFSESHDGKPSELHIVDLENKVDNLLSHNPNVDPGDLLLTSDEKDVLAVSYEDGLPGYDFVNAEHPESKAYAGLINAFPKHAVRFTGISRDGRYILFVAYSDVDPGSYYLFDRQSGSARFLLAAMDWIKPEQMSPMQPIQLTARDGTPLHGYLTLPKGSDGKNLPLIFHPHGGPHGPRDQWGFNPEVQFLANRGYAVLQLNFRGSGGYGKGFERMGYRNWGTTMIDDMTDSVDWAINQGIADKDRICTYGASYGGYAALMTVVREPTKYQCTVGYVGVYSLPLMFKDGDIPETESGQNFQKRVLPETLEEQRRQSAAYNIDKINIPVMLVQGAKDQRVPISQYRLLRDNLTDAGKPPEVTVVAKKEGHGFYNFDNEVDLYTKMIAFFDKHIGAKRNH